MKNKDIETRGRPRNKDFEEFCNDLANELPFEEMRSASSGECFIADAVLLEGDKQEYLNFRNSASFKSLKKKLIEEGFEVSLYYIGGKTHVAARKAR